jgi:hypothetical protein
MTTKCYEMDINLDFDLNLSFVVTYYSNKYTGYSLLQDKFGIGTGFTLKHIND